MATREQRAKEIQKSIRRVLLNSWDPLRVAGEPHARDEYDVCIAAVYRLLASGAPPEQVAQHLRQIADGWLGPAGRVGDADLRVARELCSLNVRLGGESESAYQGDGPDRLARACSHASILRRRVIAKALGRLRRDEAVRIAVRRRVTGLLAERDLRRTKTSFWTRPAGPVVEFMHLHLYRSECRFRAHLGIRVLNEPFEAIALNGPSSHPADTFDHSFTELPIAIDRCAAEIDRYSREVGEAWWQRARPVEQLLSEQSILSAGARRGLADALRGVVVQSHVDRSLRELGLPNNAVQPTRACGPRG
ncbi:MAG: hypothetical protein U0802_05260 [Candidatus Binatia bacterium]